MKKIVFLNSAENHDQVKADLEAKGVTVLSDVCETTKGFYPRFLVEYTDLSQFDGISNLSINGRTYNP